MVSRMQKRIRLCRKLQVLRSLSSTKSKMRKTLMSSALLHIYMLKLKLEAVQREYSNLMAIKAEYTNLIKHLQVPKEVKVEKIEEGLLVKVKCKKAGDTLVSILEAFEKLGLTVVQAKVSCSDYFSLEAIAAVEEDQEQLDVRDVTQAIVMAIKIGQDGKRE